MRATGRRIWAGLLATVVMSVAGAAQAGDIAPKVPIDRSKGECVLPGEQMRREHMKILVHRRDDTMYQGIRGGKASFSACLDCHMVKDDAGKPVTIESPKHFCRVCHDFTAVKVDCWSCHKSVPDEAGNPDALRGAQKLDKAGMFARLTEFLQGGRND